MKKIWFCGYTHYAFIIWISSVFDSCVYKIVHREKFFWFSFDRKFFLRTAFLIRFSEMRSWDLGKKSYHCKVKSFIKNFLSRKFLIIAAKLMDLHILQLLPIIQNFEIEKTLFFKTVFRDNFFEDRFPKLILKKIMSFFPDTYIFMAVYFLSPKWSRDYVISTLYEFKIFYYKHIYL